MDIDLEPKRLALVQRYTALLPRFSALLDRFAERAAGLLAAPIGLVTLIDHETVWVAGQTGPHLSALPRHTSFCTQVLHQGCPLLIPDSSQNPRFTALPERFYAGVPLRSADGFCIGTVCVLDTHARTDIGDHHLSMLQILADQLISELDLHERIADQDQRLAEFTFRQELNASLARKGDFRESLTSTLSYWCATLGADYFLVPRIRSDGQTCRIIVAVAALLAGGPYPLDQIGCGTALATHPLSPSGMNQAQAEPDATITVADTGLLDATSLDGSGALSGLVTAGLRQQFAVPMVLGGQHFAIAIGYVAPPDPVSVVRLMRDTAVAVSPLLQGRIRELKIEHAQYQLSRANLALRALVACAQSLARAASEAALIQSICKILVDSGQYRVASICFAEPGPDRRLRIAAAAGLSAEARAQVEMSWRDDASGQGPSGVAVRENRVVVLANVAEAPSYAPWRPIALEHGYNIGIALPLADQTGTAFGALTVFGIAEQGSIDRQELNLLTELASNLAAGIGMRRERARAALAVMREQIDRDRAESARRISEQRLAQLLDASPTVIYGLEPEAGATDLASFRVVEISSNLERLFGHKPQHALAPDWWWRHVHPADRTEALININRLTTESAVVHSYRIARADGSYRWVRDELSLISDPNGKPLRIVGAWVDITEKQIADVEINRLAYQDTLTGLANDHRWRAMLAEAFAPPTFLPPASPIAWPAPGPSTLPQTKWGIFLLELEGLSQIGEVWGQPVVDAVVKECARRLQSALRASDGLARLTPSRFGVLLSGLSTLKTGRATAQLRLREIARKLARRIASPIRVGERTCHVTATIGIAAPPDDAPSIEAMMQSADIALNAARAQRDTARTVGAIAQFSPPMQQAVTARHTIESELRTGLNDERFELWLQSQVDNAGRVVGAEALLRLRSANGSLIPPGLFIPIAEATGLISRLGAVVHAKACAILASTPEAILPRLSINVSPRELHRADFVRRLCHQIRDFGIAPHRLILEITESTLIERPEAVVLKLNALRAFGFNLSIDDFGTGYSSLASLRSLPIQEIKLDRSFISDLPDQMRSVGLVKAMLTMARRVGFSVVAEGVETEAQAHFLQKAGCPTLQGYLFGRPIPATDWLAQPAPLDPLIILAPP